MKKNFFYFLFPSILEGAVGLFLIIPISTYYLDPKDFGIFAIIAVFAKLASAFSAISVGWVLGGNYYNLEHQERKVLLFNTLFVYLSLRAFWLCIFAFAANFLLASLVQSYEPRFLYYFWMLLVAELFNCVWEVVSYVIILQKRAKIFAVLDLVRVGSNFLALCICLVALRLKTISLVFAQISYCFAGCIFCLFYIKKYITLSLRMKWIKEVLKLGTPAAPLNVLEMLLNSVERFFIQRWIGLSMLGIYSHALNYRKMFMFPIKAYSNSLSPELLEGISVDDRGIIENVKVLLKKWFGLLLLAGISVVFFSKEVIAILTHGKFTQAAPLVSLWFLLMMVYSFGIPYSQFLYAKKKNRFVLISEISLGIVSLFLMVLGIKYFGAVGAVISVVSYYLVLYLLRKFYSMSLGSHSYEGKTFWYSFLILTGLIIYVNVFNVPLVFRSIIFLLSTVLIFKHFKFYSLIHLLLNKYVYVPTG